MDSAYFSIAGPKDRNQDSLLIPFEKNGIIHAAVADGVGGHADGKFASETAINAIAKFLEEAPLAPLIEAFAFAREAIKQAATQFPLSKNMATTLSVVRLVENSAEVGHVGDSRIYHLRSGGLISRTIDQTEVAELVRQNVFTPEEALRYPRRNVLLSSLSVDGPLSFFGDSFKTQAGDAIVLCTDGFYNSVKKADLIALFDATHSSADFADRLKALIASRTLKDDATFVTLRL